MALPYDVETARQDWPGGFPPMNDSILSDLLEAARIVVLAYAPALAEGEEWPVTYRTAQLMQARAIWNASQKLNSGSTEFGAEGFQVQVFPLDWNVKALLRPQNPTGAWH